MTSQPMSVSGTLHTVNLAKYTYRPMRNKDSIRLIHLHHSVDDSAPITVSILRARLSDAKLEYEALSYTWGNQYSKQIVFCRNPPSVLEVTQNCYSALRRLRNASVRCLWIDAICINQNDDNERSAQVQMMDRVFAIASRVIVDLGEETSGSRLLFNELVEAEQSNKLTGKYTRPWPNDKIIQELDCLFRRPWFSRVWVIQEVVANPCVRIMCGTRQSSWAALHACRMGYAQTRLQEYKSPDGLWQILLDTRSLAASDPRDRVFALLYLLGSGLDIRDQLVDYSQSSEVIFTRVGKLLLSQVGLKLLTATRHGHTREMPSWVPDWSQKHQDNFCRPGDYDDQEFIDREVVVEGAASKTSQFDARCLEHVEPRSGSKDSGLFELQSVGKHLSTLKVKGVRIGTIIYQSGVFSFSDFDDAKHAFLKLLGFFHSGHSDKHLPWCTEGIYLPSDLLAVFRRQWPLDGIEFVEWITRGDYTLMSFDSDVEEIDSRLKADDSYYFTSETVYCFRLAMESCRLFVTEDDTIGIAPQNAQAGDVMIGPYFVERNPRDYRREKLHVTNLAVTSH
ncbi:uncharacterized protein PAC_12673 [Phialocephala subalpina]|uniref:Heterokaryon incompatibility domain-containing protein n=1 Tax=Phialocephala subalpina TaxID=576137 RepID=A0A1L7XCQ5_9HELO|nr:uncharacterized protein PAC_12673 [Phialocephala subalpina]